MIYYELFLELTPSLVGLALTYCIALANSSQYTVKQSAEVENTVSLLIVLAIVVTGSYINLDDIC